ncbi:MAG: TonB family protein, partial [Saprospiraceae bacterium]
AMAKPAPVTADTTPLAWNETEKKSDLDKLRREVRAEKAGPVQSEPAEGWVAFGEYLRQNARLPADARDHNVSGSVRLRFSVNANGDPQNFVVLHSLGYGCDEEAKRLVQNWNWVRGQQPEVTMEVRFVR